MVSGMQQTNTPHLEKLVESLLSFEQRPSRWQRGGELQSRPWSGTQALGWDVSNPLGLGFEGQPQICTRWLPGGQSLCLQEKGALFCHPNRLPSLAAHTAPTTRVSCLSGTAIWATARGHSDPTGSKGTGIRA